VSFARLWAICRQDLHRCYRRPLFWIWAAIVALCALLLASGGMTIQAGESTTGGMRAHVTSAFNNAFELSILGGLFYTFFVAVLAGMEVIRDGEARVEGFLRSTPLRPSEYVWGKMLAALIASGAILSLQVGLSIFFKHATGMAGPELIGNFSPLNYLQPVLLFCVPLIVFTSGVAFAIGESTRRAVLVNLFPLVMLLVSIFLLWMWSPSWLDPRIDRVLMLVDPTGYRWLDNTWLDVDRGVEFYNSSLIGFDAGFYLSRLVFLAIGLGAVLYSQRHLSRTLRGARVGRKTAARALSDAPDDGPRAFRRRSPLGELSMSQRRPFFLASVLRITRVEAGALATHPGVWLFLPLLVLNATITGLTQVGAFETPLLMTPGRSAVSSLNELTFTLLLFLMFFTVEGINREKRTRLGSIAYAAPVSNRALMLGKLLATSLLGLVPMAAVFAVCAILILAEGRVPLDLEPYGIVYGLLIFPVVIFWNTFMAMVYSITRNRGASYAIGLGAMISIAILFARDEMSWVWNWSLASALTWTDLGTFEMDRLPLLLNRLMVLSAGLFFFVLAARVFPRRNFDSTSTVLRLRPWALVKTGLLLSPLWLIPVGLGIALQKGINAGPDGERYERWGKAYWSRNKRTWTDTRAPEIVLAEVELELDPARSWLHSKGLFGLINPHTEPLKRFALTGGPHWRSVTWKLDGQPYEPAERCGLYVFEVPLNPGGETVVSFDFEGTLLNGFSKNGFGSDEFILESGVVLTSFTPTFVPLVGYQEGIGVDEDNAYDAKQYDDDFYLGQTGPAFGSSTPFPVTVTITAPPHYRMNSVGVLAYNEVDGDMRKVTWKSDQPVRFFNVVGGEWDVRRGEGTAIYYYPPHDYNLDEMIEALDGARRYYSEWFHPYPWEELRVSEFAAYAGYAQGFPTNITFSEELGFLTKSDVRSNAAFFVTAHESAHQWWGNLLMPGKGPGGNLLSEGTANFSTMLLFEEVKGIEQRIEFCRRLEERYAARRSVDSEQALIRVDGSRAGDGTLTYDKMAWACWMLMHHLGREDGMYGFQSFFQHYMNSRDHPVIQDLVDHLRAVADDQESYDAFTHQWFFDVVLPEYVLEEASYDEEARATSVRLRNAGTGTMPVEIAVMSGVRFPEEGRVEEPFQEVRTTITLSAGEEQELTLPCDFVPDRVIVDPDAMVLQLGRKRAIQRL